MLLLVGFIHLIPVSGVFGAERLDSLYGLSFGEPNLEILMRHRAVLFALLGVFLIFAAFRPMFRTAAFIAGLISVVSFLWIAVSADSYNAQVGRVVTADIVAMICLVVGFVAHIYAQSRTPTFISSQQ
ncbi:MAG TPA: phosphopantetheine adenylyltransferase [Burkholderiaceae bacterium]|nr:phosphopantetheine adenylyltransferase [Burkholderiaceae bacterium]